MSDSSGKINFRKISINSKIKNLENIQYALDQTSILVITNTNGDITYVNEKFCKISKYSETEILGKNHRILKSNFHSKEFYENMWKSITNGKIWHGEIKNKAKDGTYFWQKITIIPIFESDGNILQYIAISTDITDQKQWTETQVLRERFELIGELSSRIAHDIRNPLSVIRAAVENLKILYAVDDVKLKNMDKIDRSIDRITHQIEDVLDFVRHDRMLFEKYSLSEILADALDSIHIPNKVQFELPKNDIKLWCDKKRISVVLVNIILNGIQAINENGRIKIRFKESDNLAIIEIEDSGSGIPEHIIDKIFEPMFTTKQQGTGLGLSSVKSIISAHNGTISVKSQPTIFTVTLPKKSDLVSQISK
ncbi:MAG: PAS domain-containing protein [Nitrosarchaeum sp.]|nr:PAS domain-containing protein [Nitrosarchaeum sp.]